jgi:hypothetical protein
MDRDSDAIEGHGLLLPFDSDEPEFARGFEAGRLWTVLQLQPDERQEVLVHASNAEMALRIAERTGRTVRGAESDDGAWITLTFDATEDEIFSD